MPDILDYTLAQVRGFLAATTQCEAAMDARLLSLVTLGARGEQRSVDQALERFNKAARP